MNHIPIYLLIFLMTAVTYLPRALPSVLLEKISYGPKTEKFLRLIPYTAMSALIFPAILTVDPSSIWPGIIGSIAAFLVAWRGKSVMVCVLAAIAADFLFYMIV